MEIAAQRRITTPYLRCVLATLSKGEGFDFRPLTDQEQTHFAPIFNGRNGRVADVEPNALTLLSLALAA